MAHPCGIVELVTYGACTKMHNSTEFTEPTAIRSNVSMEWAGSGIRDNIDHASRRIRAVERRPTATQHFDAPSIHREQIPEIRLGVSLRCSHIPKPHSV